MADYGFATVNLLSTSTSTFQVNFSSPQSGVIVISTSPFNLGSGGSFTFPSGDEYYYFSNQSSWCVNVDLSKYYVVVIVYNVSSTPIDFSIQVDGSTLSVSSILSTGSCGVDFELELSNGLEITGITCCSFGNTSTGSTTIQLEGACSCSGFSCSGCPTSGGTSSLVCSSSSTTTSGTGNVQNEAFYISQQLQPTSPVSNEAFYIQSVTVSPAVVSNEAFYIQSIKITPSIVSNEAFYIQQITKPSVVSNEAFFITQLQQVVTHVYVPEFIKFISIPQAIYNVIQFNISTSAEVKQAPNYVIQISISPSVSVSVSQGTVTTPQAYEESIFEGFMAIPVIYYIGKFIIRRIGKRIKKKGGKK